MLLPWCWRLTAVTAARRRGEDARDQRPPVTRNNTGQFQSENCFQCRPLSISVLNTCKMKPIDMCKKNFFIYIKNVVISLGNVQLLTKLSLRCTKRNNFNFVFQNFLISVATHSFEKEFVSSKFKMLVRSSSR